MVELGFFIGIHPSLMNVDWRKKQIRKAIRLNDKEAVFQIYKRRLTEGETSTSCMVVRCARKDAQDLQIKLTNAGENSFGKGVEYIPYSVGSVWTTKEFEQAFQHQNQYIYDMGAIQIQEISE